MSGTVSVLGLDVPKNERITVEEREALELYSIEASQKNHSPSRQKYEALRILVRLRTDKQLPEWLSAEFDKKYRAYFDDDYIAVELAVDELLEAFTQEQTVKKARRQAAALAASGNVKALSALIQAAEQTIGVFKTALAKLEKDGQAQN